MISLHAQRVFMVYRFPCEALQWHDVFSDMQEMMVATRGILSSECSCRPVSDPLGFLLGAGPPTETKESKQAWGDLVKSLRKRGPAAKGDPSLAAGLMRLTGAGGETSPCQTSLLACLVDEYITTSEIYECLALSTLAGLQKCKGSYAACGSAHCRLCQLSVCEPPNVAWQKQSLVRLRDGMQARLSQTRSLPARQRWWRPTPCSPQRRASPGPCECFCTDPVLALCHDGPMIARAHHVSLSKSTSLLWSVMHWISLRTQFFLSCLGNARSHRECIAVARRFNIATTPSLQDGIAKELSEAGLLAHGEQREPRLPSYEDVDKLPYLTAVSAPPL